MSTKELNRDIKRLASEIYRMSFYTNKEYFDYIAGDAAKEFKRLYYADTTMESYNLQSLKIMFRLNLSHRFIPLHQFGLNVEIFKTT